MQLLLRYKQTRQMPLFTFPSPLVTFFSDMIDAVQHSEQVQSLQRAATNIKLPGGNPKNKKIIGLLVGAIIISLVSFFSGVNVGSRSSERVLGTTDSRAQAPQAKATQQINKEVLISLKNDKQEEISKVKYVIENVELQDEILIKGQRARAVKGRTFFIVNLKITNSHTQAIQINSRDYIRLTVNNSKEQLAADIHNDPVQIQAISTKYTRVGFPINDTDKNLTLYVGEINGTKQQIKVNF